MLLRPLIAAAGLAAATQAFLLPPETNTADVEKVDSLPLDSLVAAEGQSIGLECTGCPPVYKNKHGNTKHHKGHGSHLDLTFNIDHSSEDDRLMLNGFELYPNPDPFTNTLVAAQVPHVPEHHKGHKGHKEHGKHRDQDELEESGNPKKLQSHHRWRPGHHGRPKIVEQQLGFSLSTHAVAKTTDEMLDLIVIDLQIIEVGSTFVQDIPNVRVHLVQSPSKKLALGKIETIASESAATPMDKQEDCTTMLCKWKAIIADQLNRAKSHGCGMMGGVKAGHAHHHHNDGEEFQMHHHGWRLLFKKLTSHILLPILVGIVAGVIFSIVGMIIGTLIVGLWRKFVRGQSFFPTHRCRRHAHAGVSHHKAAQKEAAIIAEEKSSLMDNQDLPPQYEEEEVQKTDTYAV